MFYQVSRDFIGILSAVGLGCLVLGTSSAPTTAQSNSTETIVIFRHGEKPSAGLGQLTCQGLNRALALPPVLAQKFGTPTALFAPDPAVQISDGNNGPFSYVRPLATIEPTAIAQPMQVNTQIGYTSISALQTAITSSAYSAATIFIAWEHGHIPPLARNLLQSNGGNPDDVPSSWPENDYDTIYVIKIMTSSNNSHTATFTQTSEGLNGKPTTCPGPAQ